METTMLGSLASIDEMFVDYQYATNVPDGYILITGMPGSLDIKNKTFLFGRLHPEIADRLAVYCTNGVIGGIRITRSAKWMKEDLLPVFVFDLPRIASFLAGFVPYGEHEKFEQKTKAFDKE